MLLLVGCQHNSQTEEQTPNDNINSADINQATIQVIKEDKKADKMDKTMLRLTGQIVFQTMEGGFYSFIAQDGSKYTPMRLPKIHHRNGLVVEIVAKPMPDMMTFMQFGEVIEIQEIKVLDDSKVTPVDQVNHR